MESKSVVPGLKPALQKRGMSQVELSEKIGISKNTISLWVRGKMTPSLDTLILLVKTLDVSADELLGFPPKVEVPAVEGICRIAERDGKITIEIEPKRL